MLVCIRLYNISCSGALNHNVFFYLDSIWSTRGFLFFLTYFKHLIDVSPPGDLPPSSLPSSQYELSCLGISRALYPSFYLAPYPWYPAFLCYIPVPRASLVRVFFMPLSECSGGPAWCLVLRNSWRTKHRLNSRKVWASFWEAKFRGL